MKIEPYEQNDDGNENKPQDFRTTVLVVPPLPSSSERQHQQDSIQKP
jgi:hypothetical protein